MPPIMPSGRTYRRFALIAASSILCGSMLASPDRVSIPTPSLAKSIGVTDPPQMTPLETTTLTGVVLPGRAVDVPAMVGGQVAGIHAYEGEWVKKGGIVVSIAQSSATRASVLTARAEFADSEWQARQLQLELGYILKRLERANSLAREGLVSAEHVEELEHLVNLTRARVSTAESTKVHKLALVNERLSALDDLQIKAPFNGILSAVYVDVGAGVAAGAPVFRQVQPLPLRLKFAVPTSPDLAIGVGTAIAATIPSLGISIPGRVLSLAAEVESGSEVIVARAALSPTSDEGMSRILAGRPATVRVVK